MACYLGQILLPPAKGFDQGPFHVVAFVWYILWFSSNPHQFFFQILQKNDQRYFHLFLPPQ